MSKIKHSVKRKLLQFIALGYSNPYISNFIGGKIDKGQWKQFCNPGLNCYSCPAASLSCPIGAMQAVSGSMDFGFSFYVAGFLLATGVFLGRFVCGYLCPFGLLQEFIHKIPTPKWKLPKWCAYIKYAVLVVFVLLMPAAVTNYMGIGAPAFCQYICPAGTLEGGIPLLLSHAELWQTAGGLFFLKLSILIVTVLSCIFVYRFFCKALCPLGAIYGLCNKISFYRLKVDDSKCIGCGKCKAVCRMDVDPVKTPDSTECIRCGDCAENCPKGAIHLGFQASLKSNDESM